MVERIIWDILNAGMLMWREVWSGSELTIGVGRKEINRHGENSENIRKKSSGNA